MGVGTEEGVECTGLIPAGEELVGGIAKESTNIGAGKGHSGDTLVEEHGYCGLEVFPFGFVVSGPHGCSPLRPCKECASQDERTDFLVGYPSFESLVSGIVESHAVKVMEVTMLPVVKVEVILWHGNLRAIEDGGLVHIVPDEHIVARALELVKLEVGGPPFLSLGVKAVDPVGAAGPAPAVIVAAFLGLDGEGPVDKFFDDGVVTSVLLDVRVNDGDKLPSGVVELLLHGQGVLEGLVPGEIFLLVCVFNIEPDDIVGNIKVVHLCIDILDVVVRDVVPAALVVAQGELLREGGEACEVSVLLEEPRWVWSKHNKDVQDTSLRDPVCLGSILLVAELLGVLLLDCDIHPGLSSVEPEDSHGRSGLVGLHEGDGAVEGHRAVSLVLKDVGVVEPVWVRVGTVTATGWSELHGGGMLGNAVNVLVAGEGNV